MPPHKALYLSTGNQAFVAAIRERIVTSGRACVRDFASGAVADQIRLLVSLDVLERRGDELILVDEPQLALNTQLSRAA